MEDDLQIENQESAAGQWTVVLVLLGLVLDIPLVTILLAVSE